MEQHEIDSLIGNKNYMIEWFDVYFDYTDMDGHTTRFTSHLN